MGDLCVPYDSHKTIVSGGGTYDDVNDDRIRPGWLLEVSHISVENQTTAFTNIRIGVDHGGVFFIHEEEKNPVADEVYWTKSHFYVSENERVKVRCTGCTSGDFIQVFIEGLLRKIR